MRHFQLLVLNRSARVTGLWLSLSILFVFGGCGSGSPHAVNPDIARQTLQDVLESWQRGETVDSWREHSPEVVVQDMDWLAGKKLQEFEILEQGEAVDANLQCQVKLTLADAQAGQLQRSVTYLVGTSPKLTVFRQVIP